MLVVGQELEADFGLTLKAQAVEHWKGLLARHRACLGQEQRLRDVEGRQP